MSKNIFIAGASGFIGRRLGEALAAEGHRIVGMTRDASAVGNDTPMEWREGELEEPDTLRTAMDGCEVAFFLVHALGTGADYAATEERWARHFVKAGRETGLQRIVYLGAPDPGEHRSTHISSRLRVGEILRGSDIPTIELRASMVVGEGSASWALVREMASKVDFAVLPSWMESRTQPVALHDVIQALKRAASREITASEWWGLPGPDTLSVREILEITSELMSGRPIMAAYFPDLLPELTTRWLQLLMAEDGEVARELALGLTGDIIMEDRPFWPVIGHSTPISFRTAAEGALSDRPDAPLPSIATLIQRMIT